MDWKEKYNQKIAALTRKIQLNPKDYYSYTNRGLAYFNLNLHELAIQNYNKAINILNFYPKMLRAIICAENIAKNWRKRTLTGQKN